MRPIFWRFLVIFLLITAVFSIAIIAYDESKISELSGELLLAANEAQNGDALARERYDTIINEMEKASSGRGSLVLAMCLSLGLFTTASLYIYFSILKPFYKLESFAQNIAAGDYTKALGMPRHNVFGAFSWAFDSMRESLNDAQKAEQDAKQANRLLIATISHDIKTPVASIRACAEALAKGQANTEERKHRYLSTIVRKSDEVANLTDDLFLHAISDMDKLEILPEAVSLQELIGEFALSFDALKTEEIPDVTIIADKKRLVEAFGNIIHNAEKYAPGSPVLLSFEDRGGMIDCIFSDEGQSLRPEDAPFIFDKFYRGKNSKTEKGSGLGLYIVRYIAENLGGSAAAQYSPDGLTIIVSLRTS